MPGPNYRLFPAVPAVDDERSTLWYTPDFRFLIVRDNTRSGMDNYAVRECEPVVQPGLGSYHAVEGMQNVTQADAQAYLNILLYPAGSTPSPERHGTTEPLVFFDENGAQPLSADDDA